MMEHPKMLLRNGPRPLQDREEVCDFSRAVDFSQPMRQGPLQVKSDPQVYMPMRRVMPMLAQNDDYPPNLGRPMYKRDRSQDLKDSFDRLVLGSSHHDRDYVDMDDEDV